MNRQDNGWTTALAGIDATALDCMQANLAVLGDACHGTGTYLRLGARLTFEPSFDGEFPTVDAGTDALLSTAAPAVGLTVAWRATVGGAELLSRRGEGPLFVVADAYHLPWLPYFRRQHLAHSFVLLPDAVIDAYHVDTPDGTARPGRWPLDGPLTDTLAHLPATGVRFERSPLGPVDGIGVAAPDRATVDRYVAAYRDAADRVGALSRLSTETWLLARARRLHARWAPDARVTAHAAAWDRLAEVVYLARRRAERGRAGPPVWADELAALLAAEATAAGPADLAGRVRQAVYATARDLFDVDTAVLVGAATLADVPGYSSFRLVELVEAVERDLMVELPPDALVATNLRDLDRLATLFARAVADRVTAGDRA
jgi:hypothetical protein